MTIYELADLLRRELMARRYANQDGRISVSFENCEIKDSAGSSLLNSLYGDGKTWDKAVADYARNISNKLLVFGAYGNERMEFQCPDLTGSTPQGNRSSDYGLVCEVCFNVIYPHGAEEITLGAIPPQVCRLCGRNIESGDSYHWMAKVDLIRYAPISKEDE